MSTDISKALTVSTDTDWAESALGNASLRRILGYDDVAPVPAAECGEPLLRLDGAPFISSRNVAREMQAHLGDSVLVRASVAARLETAGRLLDQRGFRLFVGYGYRAPEVQAQYFTAACARVAARNPDLSDGEVRRCANLEAADPLVAGHPTGGAVDVTMLKDGCEVDMGSGFIDLDDYLRMPTFAEGLSDDARQHRNVLREAMLAAGFAPFNGEWWHFCYGDKEWAAFFGEPSSLYSPIPLNAALELAALPVDPNGPISF